MGLVAVMQATRTWEVRLGTAARSMGDVGRQRLIVAHDASLDLGLAARQLMVEPDVVVLPLSI